MRKSLCVVLILLNVFIATFVYAENVSNDLYTQRDELQNEINAANTQLEEVQQDLSENLEQLRKLDENIEKSEAEIKETEGKIKELKDSISQIEEELNIVTEKYEKQKDLFQKRIVAMYESGETKYLDIVLNSKSLTDFLSSYYVIAEIAQYDEDLLKDIEEKKKQIDNAKEKLENENAQLSTIMENQTRTARILQNTKVLRENYLSKLSEQEQEIQKTIDEYNQQVNELNKQILELAKQGLGIDYIGGELAWPVPGYTQITSYYGMRYHPILHINKLHTGIDIGAPQGANFIAANDGIVTKADYNVAYGKMVIIDHGGGISTLYAHGSEILVEPGQSVKRGDPILKVGSTGYSTGPHAHFEVRINGVTTDPLPYVTTGLVPGEDTSTNTEN